MKEPEIDYRAVFQALPGAVALLTPQLFFEDANEEWLHVINRSREHVIGHYMPHDYADRPNHPNAAVARNIEESLRRVARTGRPETMELQRFDPTDTTVRPRATEERFWSMTNIPVPGPDGRVALLLHRVEEVTELIQARVVALSLQEAMLPAPRAVGRHPVAVRYRPAISALEVGATGTTWWMCRATASGSPWATWSVTDCPQPASWGNCAALSAPRRAPAAVQPAPWRSWSCTPAPS